MSILPWLAKPKFPRLGLACLLAGCLVGVFLMIFSLLRIPSAFTMPLVIAFLVLNIAGVALVHTHVLIFGLLAMGLPLALLIATSLEGSQFWHTPLYWIIVVPSVLLGVWIFARCADERKNIKKEANNTSDGIRQPADGSPKPSR